MLVNVLTILSIHLYLFKLEQLLFYEIILVNIYFLTYIVEIDLYAYALNVSNYRLIMASNRLY